MICPAPFRLHMLTADDQLYKPGGRHGARDQAFRAAMGRTRSSAFYCLISRCFSQLSHYLEIGFGRDDSIHCLAIGLCPGNSQACSAIVPRGRNRSLAAYQADRSTQQSNARIPPSHETGCADQPHDLGLWVFHLVGRPLGRALGQGHAYSLQSGSIAAPAPSRRLFRSSPEAHHERQTRRNRLCQSKKTTETAKKKP